MDLTSEQKERIAESEARLAEIRRNAMFKPCRTTSAKADHKLFRRQQA